MTEKTGAAARREQIRKQHWPKVDLWTGEKEYGWFFAPRTLPLILSLIDSKEISSNLDPSSVYIELISRHRGEGIIEMGHETEHAFASGYEGNRAVRTWTERMKSLEENGFIKTVQVGNQPFKYVALVHPTVAIQRIRDAGKIPDKWWNAYLARKRETKEATYEQYQEKKKAAQKVVPFDRPQKAQHQKIQEHVMVKLKARADTNSTTSASKEGAADSAAPIL
jgi:hypothetical protein